jgi:hypothetical protein
MTSAIVLNIVLATAAVAAVLGVIAWAIATQQRDRGVTLVRRPRRLVLRTARRPRFRGRSGLSRFAR